MLSIAVSLLFFPIGLTVLLFPFLSNDGYEKGNVADAKRYSRYARNSAIALVIFEAAILMLVAMWVAVVGFRMHAAFDNFNRAASQPFDSQLEIR